MSLISIYQSASPSAGSPSVMEFYFASPVVTDGDYSIDGVDLPNYESAFSGSSGWTLTSGQPSASPMIITSVADGIRSSRNISSRAPAITHSTATRPPM